MIRGMARAKHPLVAANAPYAPADLIGERLETQVVIRRREGTADGVAGAVSALCGEERVDRFLETPVEQVLVALERNRRATRRCELRRDVEPVNREEEEQRPHALVEVVARSAKRLERVAFGQQ